MPTISAPPSISDEQNPYSLDWSKLIPFILITACLLAYANSFRGSFILDDSDHILNDKEIQGFFPLSHHFHITDRRVLVKLSLMINYALGEFDPRGYHFVNLAIHIIAGLALYGIVRRTLWLPRYGNRFDRSGPWIAMTCALFWMLHPLQTQAVTYIIQRSESMMGMFYLLTLYCAIRTADASCKWLWSLLSLGACALGMVCKEVMITAPIVVLLYDRTFMSDSFFQTLRRRGWFYAGLFLPYLAVIFFIFGSGAFSDLFSMSTVTAGFHSDYCTPLQYATVQTGVILHYLRLTFWPGPLCLDYFDWPLPRQGQLLHYWPSITVIALIAILGLWGVWKRTWWGFLTITFFLILLPSSSFMPIRDLVVEHRIYLPLACVIVLVVVGGWAGLEAAFRRREVVVGSGPVVNSGRVPGTLSGEGWTAAMLVLLVAGAMGVRTFLRNCDYYSGVDMYRSITQIRPGNPRGWRNLASALTQEQLNNPDDDTRLEAIDDLNRALSLTPGDIDGHIALAAMYLNMADSAERQQGRQGQTATQYRGMAIEVYKHVLQLTTTNSQVSYDLGVLLMPIDPVEAEKYFRMAIAAKPNLAQAHNNLGLVMLQLLKFKEAEQEFRLALATTNKGSMEWHNNLASLLADLNRLDEALVEFQAALQEDPHNPRLLANYGRVLLMAHRYPEAQQALVAAQELSQSSDPMTAADAIGNLGELAVAVGHPEVGLQYIRRALQLNPGNPRFMRQLAWLLATGPASLRNPDEALDQAQKANTAMGDMGPDFLDTLAAAYAAKGQFKDAAVTARRALSAAKTFNQVALINKIPAHIAAFDAGRPWVEVPATQPDRISPQTSTLAAPQ